MRLCAFTKQARFILKFNFRRFGMNLLVNNSDLEIVVDPGNDVPRKFLIARKHFQWTIPQLDKLFNSEN